MEWVKWNRGGGHVTLQTFYDRFLRQSLDWEAHYKWAFVRNPWDRAVSTWECHTKIKEMGYDTFEKFINALYKERKQVQNLPSITWGPFKNVRIDAFENIQRIHFFPMLPLLKVNNEVCMDFIGRYENLEEDWSKIVERLSTPENKLSSKLPRRNIRKNKEQKPYQEYYTPDLINQVGEIYQEDVEYFGYKAPEPVND
jgi:hypothetical protein